MIENQHTGKDWIKVRLAVSFVSDTNYNGSIKDEVKFIKVMCRYNTINNDFKGSYHQLYVNSFTMGPLKMFYCGTTNDGHLISRNHVKMSKQN